MRNYVYYIGLRLYNIDKYMKRTSEEILLFLLIVEIICYILKKKFTFTKIIISHIDLLRV